ncbi:MAG: hypothetical protein ACW9W3_05760 [Candidatus Nitrosopumilus sp. bin_68KS]
MVGFVGSATAIHDPNQTLEHSIILPNSMRDVSFDEFMEWCVPHFGDKCVELEKNRVPIIKSPLKQHAIGIPYDEIQCKDRFELVAKMPSADPKCVKPESVQELVIRGWASTNKSLELTNTTTHVIEGNENPFELQYSLHGATLESIVHDVDANSVHIKLDESAGGNMVILLPHGLVDAQIGQSDADDSFFLLIDGEENLYGEKYAETGRIITIWFPNGAHDIEIIIPSWM